MQFAYLDFLEAFHSMGGELSKHEGVLLHSFQSEAESLLFLSSIYKIYALITNF